MNKQEKRGSLYLLTGLALGLVFGLIYSLKIQPTYYIDTSPNALQEKDKDQYRALIALAYLANQDLVRARARLDLLGDRDIYQALADHAQRSLMQDSQSDESRALTLLASRLGSPAKPGSVQQTEQILLEPGVPAYATIPVNIPNPGTYTTPASSFTPNAPSILVTPTSVAANMFVLQSLEKICEPKPAQPLFQVEALGKDRQPLPGVLIILTWENSEQHFYTGLNAEKGLGYAEYPVTPGIIYSLKLEENGIPIQDLTAPECRGASGETYPGSWLFQFIKN